MPKPKSLGLLRANINQESYIIYDTKNKRVGVMYNYIVDFVNFKMPVNIESHVVVGKQIDIIVYQLGLSTVMNRWLTPNEYAEQEGCSLRSVRKFIETPLALYLGVQRVKLSGVIHYRLPSTLSCDTWRACVARRRNDDKRRAQIVSYLKANGPTKITDLTFYLSTDVGRSAVLKSIAGMVTDGIIVRSGKARGAVVDLAQNRRW